MLVQQSVELVFVEEQLRFGTFESRFYAPGISGFTQPSGNRDGKS